MPGKRGWDWAIESWVGGRNSNQGSITSCYWGPLARLTGIILKEFSLNASTVEAALNFRGV